MEVWTSFTKWLGEKTGSPLYFTYIGFFIVWNWKFFDVIFIESPALFTTPKLEYISQNLYFRLENFLSIEMPAWLLHSLNQVFNYSYHLIPPAILTLLSILYLPKLQKWALGRYLNSSFDRKKMYATKQREYNEWILNSEKKEEETLEAIADVKRKQVKQKEAIEKTKTTEEKWKEEFDNIKLLSFFSQFSQLTDAVYKHGGKVKVWSGAQWVLAVQPDVLAFADSIGLITINAKDADSQQIAFTEKGKYFVSKYIEKIETF